MRTEKKGSDEVIAAAPKRYERTRNYGRSNRAIRYDRQRKQDFTSIRN